MDEAFGISEHAVNEVVVVTVTGEIDVATAPALRERLYAIIERGGSRVVVDLLAVTFIDSTALGVLIGALKRCREHGTSMHLVVAEARILKVFEITGLTDLFTFFPTLDEATRP